MKQRFKLFGFYSLYWVIFFVIARLIFLLYQNSLSFDLSIKQWGLIFLNGLRIDLSTVGYIMGINGLLITLTTFTRGIWINRILKPLTFIFLFICSGIVFADLELYSNWGFRMDSTPLMYLTKPGEAMASTEVWLSIVLFAATVLWVVIGMFIYKRKLEPIVMRLGRTKFYAPLIFLILTGSMIIPIRGGLGIAPIKTGTVYFSNNRFANHSAVNVVWNVVNSLVYRKNQERSYDFMDKNKAIALVNKVKVEGKNRHQVIDKEYPNIFIIMLESFSSKVVGVLNDKWDATPNLNKLSEEGILFTNFYASGDRSDKGLVSILSSYPSQPTTSIMKTAEKTESLPSIFRSFSSNDYETSFYYGGDIEFAGMKSYLLNMGVQNLISDNDFDSKILTSKWGAHDEHLFNKIYYDLSNRESNKPFFKVAFTLSSHDPFDVPMKPVFEETDKSNKFLNSVYYTDSCLGDFINKVKRLELWDNSVFILIADHGAPRPGKSKNYELDKFKIPMLWLGGAINDSIKYIDKLGSQIDISKTLLNQLNISSGEFELSRDLFSDSEPTMFYAFNDGFCFATDTSKVIYDNEGNLILYSEGKYEPALENGKAFLQTLMIDYLER